MQQDRTPFLAVYMITYNHESFIAQAVESVMVQRTNFDVQLYIGEDNSTDKTRAICESLQQKYPGRIVLFSNKKNLGPTQNAMQVFNAVFNSSATYIAMLEGDDYWTDPLKLQKQVDFLEANPKYVMTFHKANVLQPDGSIVDDFLTKVPEKHETIADFIEFGNYIHTPSVVFRNVIGELPFEYSHIEVGDQFLYTILAGHGNIKYIDELMCTYRYGVGIFSSLDSLKNSMKIIKLYSCLLSYLKDEDLKKIVLKRQYVALEKFNRNAKYKYGQTEFIAKDKSFTDILKITIKKIISK